MLVHLGKINPIELKKTKSTLLDIMLQNISKFLNQNENEEHTIPDNLRSKELEWKLALLVRNVDDIEEIDLKFVKITKIDVGTKKDLFTSYRLDFSVREKLNLFKKKYKNILL